MRTIATLLLCAVSLFAAEIGSSPSFTVRMTEGANVQIQSRHGKTLVLVLMLTTCPHCQDLIAKLGPISKEYASKGVEVLACAIDTKDAADAVKGFKKQFAPAFPMGYADPDAVNQLVGRSVMDSRPFYVPHVLILDREGKLRGNFPGGSQFIQTNPSENLRAELDRMLAAKAK